MGYTEDLEIDLKNIKSIKVVKSDSQINKEMIKGKSKAMPHPSLKTIWNKC